MREPVGECHELAVIACSRSRPKRHVRGEAGIYDGEASFLSSNDYTNNNELVTNVNDDLTNHMIDGHEHDS